MITWIQKTFQQHFRTMFIALLAAVIISFVFITNASGGFGRDGQKRINQTFFDRNLGTASDAKAVFGDAQLSVSLTSNPPGYRIQSQEQLEDYAKQRYAALYLANQLHVPAPTDAEIAEHVRSLQIFAGQDGQFDAKRYTEFRDTLKANPQTTEADLSRILADDVRFARVQKLLSGPGYVLPGDVAKQLIRADSTWTLGVATVDQAGFNPDIPTPDAALKKYFEDNAARYTIPPQVRVDAIEFTSASLADQVKVTDTEVRSFYDANPARFPKPPEPKSNVPAALAANPVAANAANVDADFAAVRPQVEAALKLERAQRLATRAASDFTVVLHDQKITAEKLPALLASRNLTAKPLAPFSQDSVPPELGQSPDAAAEALKLGPQRLFSNALGTPAGAAVLVFQESLPSRQPAFAEVKDRVTADYREAEKNNRFTALGKSLRAAIETRLKAGDAFDKAAAAAATSLSVKVDAKLLPAFTLRAPPPDLPYAALSTLETLEKGKITELLVQGDKGTLVYVQDKVAPDLNPSSPGFVAMQKLLSQFTANQTATEYLRELVAKEEARIAAANPAQ